MSMDKQVAELDEVLQAEGTHFDTVEAYGKKIGIGSLSSADMLEWLEENDDATKKKVAGVRLLVKSLVGPKGDRIPEEKREEAVKAFLKKDNKENGKVIAKVLELNGLTKPKQIVEALKNESSEATTAPSPSDSPSN